MVSSITRQSMGTNRTQASMQQHPEKSDVEGGVPVEGPLDRETTPRRSDSLSLEQRLSSLGQRVSTFWQNHKKMIILGGIGFLLIVIVVVISVTVSGRDTNEQTAAVPARDQELTDIMLTITSSEDLFNPESPQYEAKEWMINEDPLVLTPSETVSDERILQRYALAVFYFATDGPESWNPNSWMAGNECSGQFWIGLSCDDYDEVRAMAFGKCSRVPLSYRIVLVPCVLLISIFFVLFPR